MTTVTDPVAVYVAEFSRDTSPASAEPAWLTRQRERAIEAFRVRGFPSTSDEEWRFTSVAPIVETRFVAAAAENASIDPAIPSGALLPGVAARLVFVNGRYAAELSGHHAVAVGVRVERLAAALASDGAEMESHLGRVARFEGQPFVALNTALWTDGALITLAPGTTLDSPIQVLFLTVPGEAPPISHPRLLVVAGANSQMSIVETYVGAGGKQYFTNSVTEVVVGERAIVNHYKVQDESDASYHIATVQAVAGRDSRLHAHSVGFGGALVRNDVIVTLAGEGGECSLNGLYVADGSRLVDNHTAIDHATPHCDSREVYKGVLTGHARAVFNGKIIVRPDAQKTDAKQTNKALLLSGDAQINTKPQLEIFANDVKCTHGAAVGQMDEDALFYLRARGIPCDEARGLLVQAFAGDVLNRMPLEPLRTRMEAELLRQLNKWGGTR